ncbi:hypothetical protein E4O93_06575 [Diaphorobacter sp. DS2]|nr:hypothetical protein E4O93_06575 [Diaphorobacter sp. DS2]
MNLHEKFSGKDFVKAINFWRLIDVTQLSSCLLKRQENEKAALMAQHDVVDQKKICIVLIPVDHFCCYTVTENYFFVKLV